MLKSTFSSLIVRTGNLIPHSDLNYLNIYKEIHENCTISFSVGSETTLNLLTLNVTTLMSSYMHSINHYVASVFIFPSIFMN